MAPKGSGKKRKPAAGPEQGAADEAPKAPKTAKAKAPSAAERAKAAEEAALTAFKAKLQPRVVGGGFIVPASAIAEVKPHFIKDLGLQARARLELAQAHCVPPRHGLGSHPARRRARRFPTWLFGV